MAIQIIDKTIFYLPFLLISHLKKFENSFLLRIWLLFGFSFWAFIYQWLFKNDIQDLNQSISWLNISFCFGVYKCRIVFWDFVLLVRLVYTKVFYIKCLIDGCQGYLSRVLSLFLLFSLDLLLCGPSSAASSCKTHILHVQLSSQHYIHTGTCQRIRVYTL